VERDCGFVVTTTGTLRVEIVGPDQAIPGYSYVRWTDDWRESSRVESPCGGDLGPFNGFGAVVVTPNGPLILEGPREPANIQFAAADPGSVSGGTSLRTMAFVGAVNGSTIQGRYVRSSRFVSRPNANNEHTEGYPLTETQVTLRKR
jgi:hypothetical protein